MAEPSAIRGALDFLGEIGIFDVVLPFLLIFSISFAILEKTAVLGKEKFGDDWIPRKNLNSIVAFVMAFLVVASSKLVELITQISSQLMVVLVIIMLFLTLVGSFQKQTDDGIGLESGWKTAFMIAVLICVVLITLNALKTESGDSWLEWGFKFLSQSASGEIFATVIFFVIILVFIVFLTKGDSSGS